MKLDKALEEANNKIKRYCNKFKRYRNKELNSKVYIINFILIYLTFNTQIHIITQQKLNLKGKYSYAKYKSTRL